MDGPFNRTRTTRRYPSPPTSSGIPSLSSSSDRGNVLAREALLGNASAYANGHGNGNSGYTTTNEYLMEQQNNEYVEHLTGKMSLLKEITLQIGDEVNSQNALLSGM
ncbi:hypothetical protein HDU93_004730, partial [Gonapodya sp. JEL0774]